MCFDVMVTDDAQRAAKHVSAVFHNCTALTTEHAGRPSVHFEDHLLLLKTAHLPSRFYLGRTSNVEIIDHFRVARVLIVARDVNRF